MRFVLLTITLALALTATATAGAGSANLCAKGGWATAQTDSGGSFGSMAECAKAKDVFAPTLVSSAGAVKRPKCSRSRARVSTRRVRPR